MDVNGRTAVPAARERRHPRLLLTKRECEVLNLLALGYGTEQIAEELFISTTTVRNHVEKLLHKLGVHTRLEAVLLWMSDDDEKNPGSRTTGPRLRPDSSEPIQPPQ